jgi:type III secretion system FlhB-like substrate exporter
MEEKMEISIPKEILEKAKERGVDIEKFKKVVNTFAILDITARASKLSREEAEKFSKRIKESAWKKIFNKKI